MMFKNPIQTQTQAGASAPAPVQNNTVQAAVSGLSGILGWMDDLQQNQARANAVQGPEAWQVKEEWETEGSQEAVLMAKTYNTKLQTEGRAKAEIWLNRSALEVQGSLGATAGDKFRSTLTTLIGKNSDVSDREAEQTRKDARQAKLEELELEGTSLLLAQGKNLGLDPSRITREDAIAIAMVHKGEKDSAALLSAQNAITIQGNTMADRDRKLKSQATATITSASQTADVRALLGSTVLAMKQRPNEIETIKSSVIADLELRKSQLLNTFSQNITAAGGNIADVDQATMNGVAAQIDATINVLRGDYQAKQMEVTLDMLSKGTTLNVLGQLPSESTQSLLVQNAIRLPIDLQQKMVENVGSSATYNPSSYVEVIGNLQGLGAAGARQNTSVTVDKSYRLVYDLAHQSVNRPESHSEAAGSIVSSFMNSFNAGVKVRSDANSGKGLPVLMDQMARNPELVKLRPAIEEAAAKEGLTVDEMFTRSVSTMFRESVYPSLSIEDRYVVPNLDIQYSSGKFSVTLKEPEYRKQSGLERNIAPHSGRDLSLEKVNLINQRLKRVEQVLNSSALAYKNIGGNPDDLGAAMKYQLEVAAGISQARNTPVEPVAPAEPDTLLE